MKGVSRNKFLLCFRPVHLDARERSAGPSLPYIAGNGNEPIPCPRKRFLSQAVRSVLYQMILRKDVRDKKGFSSSKRSSKVSASSFPSSSSSYASNENKTEGLENEETKPSSVPESTNQHKASSRKPSTGTKQNQNASTKLSLINSGLFLFLVSLAMTVLWGKLSAILFTSIWMCFLALSRGVFGYRRREEPARLKRSRSARNGRDAGKEPPQSRLESGSI